MEEVSGPDDRHGRMRRDSRYDRLLTLRTMLLVCL